MATAFTMANLAAATNCPKKEFKWQADKGNGQIVFKKQTMNFTAIAAAASSATQAANDTFQTMNVRIGDIVLACGYNIAASSTATASCDFDLGLTGGDVDGFIDGIEGDDATPTVVAAPFGLLSGTRFAAKDTLDIIALTAAAGTGVMDVWAIILRVG
jgi:hypothetical protein